jgi:hypothetical protein
VQGHSEKKGPDIVIAMLIRQLEDRTAELVGLVSFAPNDWESALLVGKDEEIILI